MPRELRPIIRLDHLRRSPCSLSRSKTRTTRSPLKLVSTSFEDTDDLLLIPIPACSHSLLLNSILAGELYVETGYFNGSRSFALSLGGHAVKVGSFFTSS